MKYYSEELKQAFDTEKECLEAEAAAKEAAEAKAKQVQAKKDEAKKIEDLYAAKNAAVRKFNETVVGIRNDYNKAVREARKEYETKLADAVAVKNKAELEYSTAVKDFSKKHPEGYHMTLHDGDNVMTLSGYGNSLLNDANDKMDKIFDELTKIFYI